MGLDMYLHKRTYVWSKDRANLQITGIKGVDPKKVKYIEEEFGYWRKANHIHAWFVDNVQDGEDDCKSYYVSIDDLKRLLEIVNKVIAASELVEGIIQNGSTYVNGKETPNMEKGKYIKDPTVAKELLPVREGFFFGNAAYDQWYYKDLIDTKKIIEEALASGAEDFEYHASW